MRGGDILTLRTIVIIPALNPEQDLIRLVKELTEMDFSDIFIINDGSHRNYQQIFHKVENMGCHVITHNENRGKGAAIKSGITAAIDMYGKGNYYVTADADGQHLPNDIHKVAKHLQLHPDMLVLGIRSFEGSEVPWKSRLGNRFTSLFFKLTNGISCTDTQTGLRGIPPCLEKLAANEEGERYDYEMNFLTDAVKSVPLCFVPITTVYKEQNRGSHFRPLADSVLVYGRFLRFMGASILGAMTDILLFYILYALPFSSLTARVIAASVLARIASGIVNYLVNRFWSFKSRRPAGKEALRYGTLFLCQMAASAGLTAALTWVVPAVPAKILVDVSLFFLSYVIQKNWVFRKGAAK